MGVDYNTYIGPYIKLIAPTYDSLSKRNSCPNLECTRHGEYLSQKYCAKCGSEITLQEFIVKRRKSMNEFMLEELGEEDLFQEIMADCVGYDNRDIRFMIPNCEDQGGKSFCNYETGEVDLEGSPFIDKKIFEKHDWKHFITALDRHNIEYELKVGVLKYSS